MSRLAKKPIPVPEKVEVSISADNTVTVTGPQATLTRRFPSSVSILREGGTVCVAPRGEGRESTIMLGTVVSHLTNMFAGTREPFAKTLVVEGIGFKGAVKGSELLLALGFSHPVVFPIPKTLAVTAEKNVITIRGADREVVSQFAARVRASKPPEPYKGKGIRYEGEVVRRKQGKKTT
ncbi:MAG: large subunit ribosomal protein L6 [Parcubacteria group bacterium Greene0416_79]|nr:MAG: large subunit ribosomal protein L6 [Parcubacteria group bacterium Greene0416_79]